MKWQLKFKLDEINIQSAVLLGALLVLAAVLALISLGKKKWTTKMLAEGAVCIALSFILSYIRLLKMPQGGSVTAASMLPVMAFAYLYGIGPGLLVGLVYGLLQLIQNPEVFSFAQALLDYPLAFGSLGLASIGRRLFRQSTAGSFSNFLSWAFGMGIAALGRYLCHSLSGLVFFAEYAEGSGLSPFAYSLAYNVVVMVEWVICAAVLAFPGMRIALEKAAAKK